MPTRFDWGYALAWHEGGEIKVVSALATTGIDKTKIVDKISPKKGARVLLCTNTKSAD